MPEITMTSKGQVTLPVATRRKLKLAAGAKLNFEEADGKMIMVAKRRQGRFDKYIGTVDFGIPGGRRGVVKYIRDMRDGK
jgi:AbrB family looped-hinge helix DNA binding protein